MMNAHLMAMSHETYDPMAPFPSPRYILFDPTEEELEEWEDEWEKCSMKYHMRDGRQLFRIPEMDLTKITSFFKDPTKYFRPKMTVWEDGKMIIDANDYRTKKKSNLSGRERDRCAFPDCHGVREIHGTIIKNHEFQEPEEVITNSRKIAIPRKISPVDPHYDEYDPEKVQIINQEPYDKVIIEE
jgi:hypothetical protein